MGQMHADPEELRRIAKQQRAFVETFGDRHGRLRAMLQRLNNSWRDRQFREFAEEVSHDLDQLREAASEIEMIAERIEQLVPPLEQYLSEGHTSSTSVSYQSQSSSSKGSRPLDGVTSDQGHPLTLLPVSGLSVDDIKWGDLDFGKTFKSETHHGYTGRDYLEFASHLPEVLEHVKEGGDIDDWPSGSAERACHSAFFRKQVIRLDRTPDGKIEVIEGRHRLYACLQLGIDPPVSWAGTDSENSATPSA